MQDVKNEISRLAFESPDGLSCSLNVKDIKRTQKKMKIDLEKLSEKELIELNNRIVERLKFLDSMRTHSKMMEFNVGEKVGFEPSGREKRIGVLVKYNKKTVTVVTEQGERWNVSPHLLSKISDLRPKVKKDGKIIKIKDRK